MVQHVTGQKSSMPTTFEQKLTESLDRIMSESPTGPRYRAGNDINDNGMPSVPLEVDQAIAQACLRLRRLRSIESNGWATDNPYDEEFADEVRETWIEEFGELTSDYRNQVDQIARELADSRNEEAWIRQQAGQMEMPNQSQDAQYRQAVRDKYGDRYAI